MRKRYNHYLRMPGSEEEAWIVSRELTHKNKQKLKMAKKQYDKPSEMFGNDLKSQSNNQG